MVAEMGRRRVFGVLTAGALAALFLTSSRQLPAGADDQDRLSLEQARSYLLELINRDRAVLGRRTVQMDAVASVAAQKQSEEMVRMAGMSHADLMGRLPVQRYSEAGGRDRVRENVLAMHVRKTLSEPLPCDPNPTFTRAEVEEAEAAYFNEVAPNDGHRRNIVSPEHTHVGIGFARGLGDDAHVIGNAEEFVGRYCEELDSLPVQARTGETITVRGRLAPHRRLVAVGLARGPLPRPIGRAQFLAQAHYSVPSAYVKAWADERREDVRFVTTADGRFSVEAKLDDEGRPGLYYVSLWVRDPSRGEVLASLRTVVVTANQTARSTADWNR